MLPTVLCIETRASHFEVSRVLYASGAYRVYTATNAAAAMSAIAAGTVDACVFSEPIEAGGNSAASQIAQRWPDLPKIVVGRTPASAIAPGPAVYFEKDPVAAIDRLEAVIVSNKAAWQRAKGLLRTSRQLRQNTQQLRRETQDQIQRLRNVLKPYERK